MEKYKEPLVWWDFEKEDFEREYKNTSILFMIGVKRIFEALLKQYHLVCWTALNENAEKLWDHLVVKKKYYNSFKCGKLYIAMSNELFEIYEKENKLVD